MKTVADLIKWILENRTNSAYQGYSVDKIAYGIERAAFQRVFLYSFDKNEHFNGVVTGYRDDANKEIVIDDILITGKGVLKKFMNEFLNTYPGYMIRGTCRGRKRLFRNPNKLYRRIS